MATRDKGTEMFNVEDVELDEDEEEVGESANGTKATRTPNPLLKASKVAMDELLTLKLATRREQGDAERAVALITQIVVGRLSPQTPAMLKVAINSCIEYAFDIAHDAWLNER